MPKIKRPVQVSDFFRDNKRENEGDQSSPIENQQILEGEYHYSYLDVFSDNEPEDQANNPVENQQNLDGEDHFSYLDVVSDNQPEDQVSNENLIVSQSGENIRKETSSQSVETLYEIRLTLGF